MSYAEILDLIDKLVEHLAWPGVVLSIILILRGALRDLIAKVAERIESVNASNTPLGDFGMTLANAKNRLEGEPESATRAQLASVIDALPADSPNERRAQMDKSVALILASLFALIPEASADSTLTQLARDLQDRQVISQTVSDAIITLDNLRRRVDRGPDIELDADTAHRFADLAASIVRRLPQ